MLDDLRTALRSLRGSPTFTSVALTVLTLGIGAGTAIFSVVDAVVLRGLPFDEHDRLVAVLEHDTRRPETFGAGRTTPQTYLDWRQLQESFEAVAGVGNEGALRMRSESGEPVEAQGLRLTHEFFQVFRVAPVLGRAFTAEDEIDGRHRVAILSHGYWQRQYGGSPDAIGKRIEFNDQPFEIVGVMPRGFAYPVASEKPTEIYWPIAFTNDDKVRGGGRNYNWYALARLKPGVSVQQAHEQMNRVAAALDEQHPKFSPGMRVRVVSLHHHLVGKVRNWMLMLLGAVALVLLIACANVANLLLARATGRTREMGIRSALGASRWRLVRALLVEGLLLSLAGAALGVLLAYAGVQGIRAWLPAGLPRVADIGIDFRVLATAVAVAAITGVFFGIVPAFVLRKRPLGCSEGQRAFHHGREPQPARAQRAGRHGSGAGGRPARRRRVVHRQLRETDADRSGLRLPQRAGGERWHPDHSRTRHARRVRGGGKARPGVCRADARRREGRARRGLRGRCQRRAAAHRQLEPDRRGDSRPAQTGGRLRRRLDRSANRYRRLPADAGDSAPAGQVSLAARRRDVAEGRGDQRSRGEEILGGGEVLGQPMTINNQEVTVVGVVGDIRHLGPETPPRQEGYLPVSQNPVIGMTLALRTTGDPLALLPAVRAAIWSVNKEQRISGDTFTLEQYMDRLIAQRRFNMTLLALFGALGLVIAAVGIYGVMAYIVAQRTNEIGVRMALGATRAHVVAMVLRRAGVMMAAGLALGGVIAWYASAAVRSFLFQTEPNDVRTMAAALVVLSAAGLLASAVPARRAASVDPLIALRHE